MAITDINGNFKEKRHFDAWGNIVKLVDGNDNSLSPFKILDRGYTGHEHLIGVGIVHMNGRLYDPVLHRFLSPDNYVQDPFNSQNFNRYGYVLNNPLKYTDPSGDFIEWVGAILGAGVLISNFIWGIMNRKMLISAIIINQKIHVNYNKTSNKEILIGNSQLIKIFKTIL